ncbi:MAG: hypothetical protein M3281_09090 [Chloroflexota bacterium]|nr:hypothetical protein [Chloroflexota bacterium]
MPTDEGPYDSYYSPAELRALRLAAKRAGVDAEIGAARVALLRILGSPLVEEKPELLLRAVESVVRAIRAKHQITGGAAENLIEAADKVLKEMGYDGEG